MRNLKLIVEYDGTRYAGWQRQENAPTIQGEIEQALRKMLLEKVGVIGAGRTDAGVHAQGQVANFHTATRLPAGEVGRGLNALLPRDILVRHIEEVPAGFHARFSARERCYVYAIIRTPSALMRDFTWYVGYPLEVDAMRAAAGLLRGTHEFGSFCKGRSEVQDVRCTVADACWTDEGNALVFAIRADRFVHGMVRSLVGTMVDVGRGYTTLQEFSSILSQNDRREGGANAPARGLTLDSVAY